MVSDEGQLRAACIARDAAAEMQRAASEMSQAVMDLKMLLADGYGGNGVMLLEELRKLNEECEPIATLHDDGHFTWKRDEFRLRYDRQRAGWKMDVFAPRVTP